LRILKQYNLQVYHFFIYWHS